MNFSKNFSSLALMVWERRCTKIRCLVLRTVQSHQERKKEFFKKIFLAAHSCSFRKNGTVDVSYPNNDFIFIFFILGPNISDNSDCLGSKLVILYRT